jgi:hypothetical protein
MYLWRVARCFDGCAGYPVSVNWWILGAILVAIVVLGFVAQRLGLIDLSDKTRRGSGTGTGGGAMGMLDEVFSPTRHEAQVELDRQTILPAPAPVAGDGDKGVYNGSVKINLNDPRR